MKQFFLTTERRVEIMRSAVLTGSLHPLPPVLQSIAEDLLVEALHPLH